MQTGTGIDWLPVRQKDTQIDRMTGNTFSVQINNLNIQTDQICWGFETVARQVYFWIIFACSVNHLIQSRIDVYTTKWIWKVLPELSGLWDATMTVLFYWFSLRTFTFGLAPCQCFGLHGVLLGTQKRGWTWLALCSPLACREGLQRQAVFGLAERSLAWRCSDWRFHQYCILMNGSYVHSICRGGCKDDDFWADEANSRKKNSHWYGLILTQRQNRRKRARGNVQKKFDVHSMLLKVHVSNLVNSSTAAAVTNIS